MAKKIIPLKSKKSSPVRFLTDGSFLGIQLWDPRKKGKAGELGREFEGLKSDLMGSDVSENLYKDLVKAKDPTKAYKILEKFIETQSKEDPNKVSIAFHIFQELLFRF